jgi:hypothetical protein
MMKRSLNDSSTVETTKLTKLLKLIEEVDNGENFTAFVELFRRHPDGRLPLPLRNLILWQQQYPDEIYVTRNSQTQELELCIERVNLIQRHEIPLKVVQCFERCLMSVKPKMAVIQTTHGHPIKKYIRA